MKYQRVIVSFRNDLESFNYPLPKLLLADAIQVKLSHISRVRVMLSLLFQVGRAIGSERYVVVPGTHFRQEADFPLFFGFLWVSEVYHCSGADFFFQLGSIAPGHRM